MHILLGALMGYLLGSFPTGYVLVKLLKGEDLRKRGSGHIGGLNVTRQAGLPAGAFTALVDAGKAYAAVALAGFWLGDPWAQAAAGIAAVSGHNWSIFLGFSGGVGVAALAGASLAYTPALALLLILVLAAVWLGAIFFFHAHRARATIGIMLAAILLVWPLGLDMPGIVLVSGCCLPVIIRSAQDWNRVYDT
jgi:glycerol-3-phosphate acyltransferase PlsY